MKNIDTGVSKSRQENTKIIINYIRLNGPVSRTDIFANTPISKATVTRIVEELVKDDIVVEVGVENTEIGRKPVYLKINPKAYCCIGIDLKRRSIKVAAFDLDRNVLCKSKESLKYITTEQELLQAIQKVINSILETMHLNKDKIIGIGIGAPGIVDFKEGILVNFNKKHRLVNIKLKQFLENKFNIPVYIDNNPNTKVLGEYWHRNRSNYESIVYVVCNDGIGSGIIVDGHVLRGKNNSAGEIGHVKVIIDGKQCGCGKCGCLEAYCSTDEIEKEVIGELEKGNKSLVTDYIGQQFEKITYELISKCTGLGDEVCSRVIDKAQKILGISISNIINLINPDIIILAGEFFEYDRRSVENVKNYAMKEVLIDSVGDDIQFIHRKLEDEFNEIGAATLVYNTIFSNKAH